MPRSCYLLSDSKNLKTVLHPDFFFFFNLKETGVLAPFPGKTERQLSGQAAGAFGSVQQTGRLRQSRPSHP